MGGWGKYNWYLLLTVGETVAQTRKMCGPGHSKSNHLRFSLLSVITGQNFGPTPSGLWSPRIDLSGQPKEEKVLHFKSMEALPMASP